MANMRIIYDDKAISATITASTTTGSLTASNMLNDYKGKVHRSTGTSVTYTLTWAQAQSIGGVGLPATNLTSTSTIRVRLYTTSGSSTAIADSGAIAANGSEATQIYNWSNPLNANSFIYGGATKSAVWFDQHYSVQKVVIDLIDSSNPAGYIDCSRVICGAYWEPKYNVSNGITHTINDTTQNVRNDSGDLLSDRGFIHDQVKFDLSVLVESDKSTLNQIIKFVGTNRNIFVSLMPDNNSSREQDYIIYGKRENSDIASPYYKLYSHSMSIEGW